MVRPCAVWRQRGYDETWVILLFNKFDETVEQVARGYFRIVQQHVIVEGRTQRPLSRSCKYLLAHTMV